MGLIRTLLALTVVLAHTIGAVFVGGQLAVQLFYMISGFLMSYILAEDRRYTTKLDFYLSRAFRIYPIYWLVAAATLLTWLGLALWSHHSVPLDVYRRLDGVGVTSLTLSNLFIFGQDWLMFTGVKDGHFQFMPDVIHSEVPIRRGLIIPPAWTLGVELSFYLIAPFLLTRRSVLLTALAVSAAIKLALLQAGLGHTDPWAACFFPSDLVYFLAGALSHQLCRPLYQRLDAARLSRWSKVATGLLLLFCLAFSELPSESLKTALLLAAFVAGLPLLFVFQSQSRLDSAIGNLSYPIYVSHMLMIIPSDMLARHLNHGVNNLYWTAAIAVTLTLAVSVFLDRVVAERVELFRRRFRSH